MQNTEPALNAAFEAWMAVIIDEVSIAEAIDQTCEAYMNIGPLTRQTRGLRLGNNL